MADDDSQETQEKEFGDEELQEIKEAFAMHSKEDKEDKALLPTTNLYYAMKEVGFDPTEAEVFVMLDEVDPNSTGFIDFGTFVTLLRKHIKPLDEEQLRTVFSVFDRDGNGFIGVSEMKCVTRNLGERYTDEEIEDMVKEGDVDGDGRINFEDLSCFMTRQ